MKLTRLFATSLIVAISVLSTQGCVFSERATNMPEGTLKLSPVEDGGGQSCGLPFVNRNYWLNNKTPEFCRNDRLNYFQVNNAPSATVFVLQDNFCDEGTGEWAFTLKTVKHPTTTVWISIASLRSVDAGQTVVPGLVLVSKYLKAGDQRDELSCVRITRSPLP